MMTQLQTYFSNVPDSHRVILLALTMFSFWTLENAFPIKGKYPKWKHLLVNVPFVLFAAPVQFLLGLAFLATTNWVTAHHFGLLYWIPGFSSPLANVIGTFILLDFFEYIYHVVMHTVKPFWMFHLVHHSDKVVDVSTTLREHPGETTIRLLSLLLWVLLSGASFWAILLRQFIQIVANVFAHAHFRLPKNVDKILSWVIVTPNFHHVHHHFERPYTNCNYGDVLSIWDRLFGTYAHLSADETIFGLDTYMEECENSVFKKLIGLPFGKYRKMPLK
jgi:sterol desaturase/sphingolipid hydroxylase (fatty acid hydroxylase superfamily)